MDFDISNRISSISEAIEQIETDHLALLSLFVFVLLTTFVAMMSIVPLDQLGSILINLEAPGFGADLNDNRIPRYKGPILIKNNNLTISSGIAFVAVIGQILNITNNKVSEYQDELSIVGIVIYIILLILVQDQFHTVAWVLFIQFLMLAYYCFAVVLIAVVSALPTKKKSKNPSDKNLDEKRPRIRNSRK